MYVEHILNFDEDFDAIASLCDISRYLACTFHIVLLIYCI